MKNYKNSQPSISIIIPLHNEEKYLFGQINLLIKELKRLHLKNYEILLIENGSADKTYKLANNLSRLNKQIVVFKQAEPNYGKALQYGIQKTKNDLIIQLDLDLINEAFIKKAIAEYGNYDILVGSKFLNKDNRPFFRHLMSLVLNQIIKIVFKYQGTDTHGIKAYKRDKVRSIAEKITVTNHFFDTTLLIAAEKLGYIIKETPVRVVEIRPSRFHFFKRITQVMTEIIKIGVMQKFTISSKARFNLPVINSISYGKS